MLDQISAKKIKNKDPCCLRHSGDNGCSGGMATRVTRDRRGRRRTCSGEERKEREGEGCSVKCVQLQCQVLSAFLYNHWYLDTKWFSRPRPPYFEEP